MLDDEFIHVLFADDHTEAASIRGVSGGTSGAVFIFMKKVFDWVNDPANLYNHQTNLRYTVAHETTHALLNERNSFGFDAGEHLIDPDGDGNSLPGDVGDHGALMYRFSVNDNQNTSPDWFDPTIRRLRLTSKEGVER